MSKSKRKKRKEGGSWVDISWPGISWPYHFESLRSAAVLQSKQRQPFQNIPALLLCKVASVIRL